MSAVECKEPGFYKDFDERTDPGDDFGVETEQCDRLDGYRRSRDADEAARALDGIRDAARAGENVMDALVAGSLARCTLGEMVQAMADVYGRYSGGPEW